MQVKIFIVGNPSREHVGAHFLSASNSLGHNVHIVDIRNAWKGPRWLKQLFWHFRGKRPTALRSFSQKVLKACEKLHPDLVLCTGIAPLDADHLKAIGNLGIPRINFLTDDPWNPKNGAQFFWKAMQEYDVIFTPRRANMDDLLKAGCKRVSYLPFGYNPDIHFYAPPETDEEKQRYACDLAILGGADDDRIPLALTALEAGLRLKLYGGYWDRVKELRPFWGGFVYDRELRLAASGATAHLCMGRRANRDEHAMRSFELPAMGASLIVENTADHMEIFGSNESAVLYYDSSVEMVSQALYLKNHPTIGKQLAEKARKIIIHGKHSYAGRLSTMADYLKDL